MFFVFSLSTWREPAPFDLKDERFKGKKLQRKDVVVTRAKIQTTNRENQNESEMCTDRLNATTSEHASHGLKRLDTEKGNESLCFFFFFSINNAKTITFFYLIIFACYEKVYEKRVYPKPVTSWAPLWLLLMKYILCYIYIYIYFIYVYI